MDEKSLNTHLEMLMPLEMQEEIGCDDWDSRDTSLRVMRIIERCVDQAEEIERLKKFIWNWKDVLLTNMTEEMLIRGLKG